MAGKTKTRKKHAQESKFSLFKNKLLTVGQHLLRLAGGIPAFFAVLIKKCTSRFWGMPRLARILSVYALTVLLAGGFFLWSIARLRLIEPYSMDNPPFDWTTYQASEEPADNSAEEIPEVNEDPAVVAEESEEANAEPVYIQAIWPVRGALFYSFNQMVKDEGLGSPLYYFSKGIAIRAVSGSNVVAMWDGTVLKTGEKDKPHGLSVTIRHDQDRVSYYGALGKVVVKAGDLVTQGTVIGTVGPGFAAEPDYLYLELSEGGKAIDPESHLP
ncbi:MAG: M23 family metallopeptidase [Bacillota bacterium]